MTPVFNCTKCPAHHEMQLPHFFESGYDLHKNYPGMYYELAFHDILQVAYALAAMIYDGIQHGSYRVNPRLPLFLTARATQTDYRTISAVQYKVLARPTKLLVTQSDVWWYTRDAETLHMIIVPSTRGTQD